MEEEWRDVPGFPGYRVSSAGRVKGIEVEFLTPLPDKDGYLRVSPYGKGHKKIHTLVAQAFIPNPYNKPTVNHKNGDVTDNRLENLEWATYKEQAWHRCHVLGKKPTSEWNRKPIALVKGDSIIYFESSRQADELLGLYPGCIQDCKRKLGKFQGYLIQNVSLE